MPSNDQMQAFQNWLEEIGPEDLGRDLSAELERHWHSLPDAQEQLEKHLSYLRSVGGRQVELPDDAYFAAARQKIAARVEIREVSVWARIKAFLIPETMLRPLPRVLAGSIVVAAIALLLLLQPLGHQAQLPGQQRYLEMIERFSFNDEVLLRSPLTGLVQTDEVQMLFRSAAMLTSPSSLSRSWSLGIGQR